MKNSHILIIVLVLIAGGVWFMTANKATDKEASDTLREAPNTYDTTDKEVVEDGATSGTNNPSGTGTSVGVDTSVTLGTVKEFTVTGKNFAFIPNSMKVKKGDIVKITFNNAEGFHDLVVEGYGVGTKQIKGGASETIQFTADKAGSFEYYCSVGTHRQMGMKGTLVVE